jgi:hypothetical protein
MKYSLPDDGQIQLIAVDDIGRVAADAFDQPGRYVGAKIRLAGDSCTFGQVDSAFRKHDVPRPITLPKFLVDLALRANVELRENFEFISAGGWKMDVGAHRRRRPWLSTFDKWAGDRVSFKKSCRPATLEHPSQRWTWDLGNSWRVPRL